MDLPLPGGPVGNALRGFSADVGLGVHTSDLGSGVTENQADTSHLRTTHFGRLIAASIGLIWTALQYIYI